MPSYSAKSLKHLRTCHPLLQLLMLNVVEDFDNSIVQGYRGKTIQTEYFRAGVSKVEWPNSRHNKKPSLAVDAAPYVAGAICWEIRQCYYFSGFVVARAMSLGIPIRTGADWDSDMDINDQKFRDVCHFELIKELI